MEKALNLRVLICTYRRKYNMNSCKVGCYLWLQAFLAGGPGMSIPQIRELHSGRPAFSEAEECQCSPLQAYAVHQWGIIQLPPAFTLSGIHRCVSSSQKTLAIRRGISGQCISEKRHTYRHLMPFLILDRFKGNFLILILTQ